jgi:hypothetical protein
VRSLRGHGATVSVARRPTEAMRMLRRAPTLVLVDLVYGPGLDRRVVRALNRARRETLVVALHDGRLDTFTDQVEHLSVDGFCRLGDWQPRGGPPTPYTGSGLLH